METYRFDRLTCAVSRMLSRRGLGRALGLMAAGMSGPAEAKMKKRKKLKRNQFNCVDVGGKCRGTNGNCCSGTCEGKKPKKGRKDASRCAAHHGEGCLAGADSCSLSDVACGTNGHCFITTGKASFCGSFGACFACTKDADCEPDFGPGAACTVCFSSCPETGGLICRPPAV